MHNTNTLRLFGNAVRLIVSFSILMFGVIHAAHALQPAYLNEMPTPERVAAEIKGMNDLDTAARLAGTYEKLRDMIRIMSDGRYFRGKLMPDEQRLHSAYAQASGKIIATIPNRFDPEETRRLGMASPRAKWFDKMSGYSRDEEAVLDKFFSPAWKKDYYAINLRLEATMANSEPGQDYRNRSRWVDAIFKNTAARLGMATMTLQLIVLGVPAALTLFWLSRELCRFGLNPSDPFQLHSGWSSYVLHATTGTVLDPTKTHVVRTHVSGGHAYVSNGQAYTQPITTSTSTIVHDQFFIRDTGNGKEVPIQLQGVNIAVRDGHDVSATASVKKGEKHGFYFFFHNHSTQQTHYIDSVINNMLKPYAWPVLMIILLTPIVCWDLKMDIGQIAIAEVSVVAAFFILRSIVTSIRARRFKRQMISRLLPILAQRAEHQIASDTGAEVTPA